MAIKLDVIKTFEFNVGKEVFKVREATVDEAFEYEKKIKETPEADQQQLMIELLEQLGLDKKFYSMVSVNGLQTLITTVLGAKKN